MKTFIYLLFVLLSITDYDSDIEKINIQKNTEILINKTNNIEYLISFKKNIPMLLIKDKDKILDTFVIIDKQLDENKIEYNKTKNVYTFTVQLFEPKGASSGKSVYSIKFVKWTENTPGFFIENMYVSIGDGLPTREYNAIAIKRNGFLKNKWEDSSYEINSNSKIPSDPYDVINIEYLKINNKTELIFRRDKSKNSRVIIRLLYDDELGFKTISN